MVALDTSSSRRHAAVDVRSAAMAVITFVFQVVLFSFERFIAFSSASRISRWIDPELGGVWEKTFFTFCYLYYHVESIRIFKGTKYQFFFKKAKPDILILGKR